MSTSSVREQILKSLIRIVVILLVGILLFVIGSMIGYGAMGGGNPFEVLMPHVWRHIMEFVR